jgi:hypothetical protein
VQVFYPLFIYVEYPVIERGQLVSHHWFNPTTFSDSTRRSTVITILDQMVSESTQRSTVITILDQVVSESTWRSSDNNFRPGGF